VLVLVLVLFFVFIHEMVSLSMVRKTKSCMRWITQECEVFPTERAIIRPVETGPLSRRKLKNCEMNNKTRK